MLVRRAGVEIIYQNVNITADIAKDLEAFTYIDNASGEADSIAIELDDAAKKWITSWAPRKGDIVRARIKTTNWRRAGDSQQVNCGTYIVDEPVFSGRPSRVSIGAVSNPADTNFMNVPQFRSWENATIQEIAQTIAAAANLQLFYDTQYNPTIQFVEQSEQTDVGFLYNLALKNGLAMKVYNFKIVMFREEEYEAKKKITAIDETDMKPNWEARTSYTDTGYDACLVEYTLPDTETTYSYTFKAPGRTGNKVLKLNETVYNAAEAERLAKAKLREANKKETTISCSVMGNVNLLAAATVNITGLGIFNGKYFVDKATHSIGAGYETKLEMHKVLEGY